MGRIVDTSNYTQEEIALWEEVKEGYPVPYGERYEVWETNARQRVLWSLLKRIIDDGA
jgi:hypothetical protein